MKLSQLKNKKQRIRKVAMSCGYSGCGGYIASMVNCGSYSYSPPDPPKTEQEKTKDHLEEIEYNLTQIETDLRTIIDYVKNTRKHLEKVKKYVNS